MRNLLFKISYNGAYYHGYQVQANALTVAEVLQDAIERVFLKREDIIGCSRTDSGVHANCYYFNLKTENKIPVLRLVYAMNRALPADVVIHECREVPLEFHSRYHCQGKEYLYRIWNAPVKNPFLSTLAAYEAQPLDIERLQELGQAFVGTHDFQACCSSGIKKGISTVKTIYSLDVTRVNEMVEFRIHGNAFLYNMVRIIVGTLLKALEQNQTLEDLQNILLSKDRNKAGRTAHPEGLYLNRVDYGGEWFE